MQPGVRVRPHRPIAVFNNTTINERTRGWGLERPGDGVAALVLEGYFGQSAEWEIFLTCVFIFVSLSTDTTSYSLSLSQPLSLLFWFLPCLYSKVAHRVA